MSRRDPWRIGPLCSAPTFDSFEVVPPTEPEDMPGVVADQTEVGGVNVAPPGEN